MSTLAYIPGHVQREPDLVAALSDALLTIHSLCPRNQHSVFVFGKDGAPMGSVAEIETRLKVVLDAAKERP